MCGRNRLASGNTASTSCGTMADDFDDLFKSPTSSSTAAGPSTPGWGGYGEDDLTTANPFADLQSSRLYESTIASPQHEESIPQTGSTPTSPSQGLARQFEEKASLSRRSTTSSKASTTDASHEQQEQHQRGNGIQRSNSTSSASTASGADHTTAPSSSEGGPSGEQRRDRVAVSPFIAPSDEIGENGTSSAHHSQLDRSEATIGESEFSHSREVPFWSRNTSTSVYDQEENVAFGGGFGDDAYDSSIPGPSASTSTPSFQVHHAEDNSSDAGHNPHTEIEEHLRSRDTEDAASIRTVGLESDNASLRSHKVYTLGRQLSPTSAMVSDAPTTRLLCTDTSASCTVT